ncbi:MAG: DUF3383 family protein [Methyloprofundus sp.]|nr:DUF3383 family protein [Methyloprofundus sp.]
MMAEISNIINVALIPEGRLAQRDNLNVTGIITSSSNVLSTSEPYRIYRSAGQVNGDFGTTSIEAQYAAAFFGTTPNPVNAGGYLVVGYWRAADEATQATAATLKGAEISEAAIIPELQKITDGSFEVVVDGVTKNASNLNLQTVTTLNDVINIINAELTGATASLDNLGIVITSDSTGSLSTLSFAAPNGLGTFIGHLLGLAEGTGAKLTQGLAAGVIAAEAMVDAVDRLRAEAGVRGVMFIDTPTTSDVLALAEWSKANSVLIYDVFSNPANLVIDSNNVCWKIKLASLTTYRMLYSKANNRKFAASYMSRTHTVNFNAENSALTMHMKELAVPAEDYTETEITAAKRVGLDIYTTSKLTPIVLTSGSNDFVDNVYNFIGFVDALQTDLFNLLKQTGTKIPQTTRGVNQLVDQCEKTTRGFVRSGVFAPGAWSSPDSFGDLATFTRSILDKGFYFLAGALSDQPQSDRQARKSPVIQGAVKNAGAIHSADVIINLNL